MKELLETACGTTDRLDLLLRGGSVLRYHTEDLPLRQTVADHTWRVMVILRYLWPAASPVLLEAALYHDAAEGLVGDLPAPIKRYGTVKAAVDEVEKAYLKYLEVPNEMALPPREYLRLKCADYLELCITCRKVGVPRIVENGARYVREAAGKLGGEDEERVIELLKKVI